MVHKLKFIKKKMVHKLKFIKKKKKKHQQTIIVGMIKLYCEIGLFTLFVAHVNIERISYLYIELELCK